LVLLAFEEHKENDFDIGKKIAREKQE